MSIKYQFELVGHRLTHPGDQPVTAIDKEITALSKAITEVRRISHDLRPALLDDLGLPAALEHIGNELAERSGLKVRVSPRVQEERLPELQAVSLFRVAQEAPGAMSSGTRRPRTSTSAWMTPTTSSYCASTDDGVGFDVKNVELSKDRGIGLTNMRERVERNGGHVRAHLATGSHLADRELSARGRMSTAVVRLIIVDDHSLVRDGLRARLSVVPGLQVIGEASSGPEALELAARNEPDLMLVDVGMRGMNGIETGHRAAAAATPRSVC